MWSENWKNSHDLLHFKGRYMICDVLMENLIWERFKMVYMMRADG